MSGSRLELYRLHHGAAYPALCPPTSLAVLGEGLH